MSLFLLRQGQLLCERRLIKATQLQSNNHTTGYVFYDHNDALSPIHRAPSLILAEYHSPTSNPKVFIPVLKLLRDIGIGDAVKAIPHFSFADVDCVMVAYDKDTKNLASFQFMNNKVTADILSPESWASKKSIAFAGNFSTLRYLEALTDEKLSNQELFKMMTLTTSGSGVCDILDLNTGEITQKVSVSYKKAMAAFKKAITLPKEPTLYNEVLGLELKYPYQLIQGD